MSAGPSVADAMSTPSLSTEARKLGRMCARRIPPRFGPTRIVSPAHTANTYAKFIVLAVGSA
jgi:hypothetical protein